jgi:hypothetical protein
MARVTGSEKVQEMNGQGLKHHPLLNTSQNLHISSGTSYHDRDKDAIIHKMIERGILQTSENVTVNASLFFIPRSP